MSFTSNKKDKPTRIAGAAMPPGVAPSNATMELRTNPRTGKREWVTKVHVAETVVVGRTTLHHIDGGSLSRQETAEINASRYRQGLPVIEVRQHIKTNTPVAHTATPSELAKSLGAGANKPGAAKKAGEAYAAEQEARRDPLAIPNKPMRVSVVEKRESSTVNVGAPLPGPKMDRS